MKHFDCPIMIHTTLENRKICSHPKMSSVLLNFKGIQKTVPSPLPGALEVKQQKCAMCTLQMGKIRCS